MRGRLLSKFRIFVFDLDGVLYVGSRAVPGTGELVRALRAKNKKIYFLTNNATRTRQQYADKLNSLGIEANTGEVMTSAYGAAMYLRDKYTRGRVFIIGEEGLKSELGMAGFEIMAGVDGERVDFVVVGLDRGFDYEKLRVALTALQNGARFVATNEDATIPLEEGFYPGAGAMVCALKACSKKSPEIVIGKPNTFLLERIAREAGVKAGEVVCIGDRPESDIVAANRFGALSILVLTGVAKKEDAKKLRGKEKPKLVVESVATLLKLV
ncbi:MAG: HAD-IIA family hydrolase [Candidatus Micrarchaeota archaeon]